MEEIDPRSIEAMKMFRTELERADETFKKLERKMGKFSKDMGVAKSRTTDFSRSMREMSRAEAQPATPTTRSREKQMPVAEQPAQRVEIGTIRIDVSGVTDKTDKDKLARDISQRVARDLKSKMGGPLSSGGYNRGG